MSAHPYITAIWAVSCALCAYWVFGELLRPRGPRKFPLNKAGHYKRSKNFER